MSCQRDTNGDGNCGQPTCKGCHPENMPSAETFEVRVENSEGVVLERLRLAGSDSVEALVRLCDGVGWEVLAEGCV